MKVNFQMFVQTMNIIVSDKKSEFILISLFSGRDFRWSPSEASDQYLDILPLFADERSALFGVHQLSMVNSDEKAIGSWIGPNGVAQVSL